MAPLTGLYDRDDLRLYDRDSPSDLAFCFFFSFSFHTFFFNFICFSAFASKRENRALAWLEGLFRCLLFVVKPIFGWGGFNGF